MDEDLTTSIVVESATETLSITGECNLCGKCCVPPTMTNRDMMVDYTAPVGEVVKDGHCRYLAEKDPEGLQKCVLFQAEADGKLEEYPKEDVAYWKVCCKKWPHYDGIGTLEKYKYLLSLYSEIFATCGYVLTVSDKEIP